MAIYNTMPAYRAAEGGVKLWAGQFGQAISALLTQGITQGQLLTSPWDAVLWTEDLVLVSAALNDYSIELASAQTTLNVLAVMYASYGCHNPASGNWPVNGGGGSANNYYCETSPGEISLDQGLTWWPVTITVCEYRVAAS